MKVSKSLPTPKLSATEQAMKVANAIRSKGTTNREHKRKLRQWKGVAQPMEELSSKQKSKNKKLRKISNASRTFNRK